MPTTVRVGWPDVPGPNRLRLKGLTHKCFRVDFHPAFPEPDPIDNCRNCLSSLTVGIDQSRGRGGGHWQESMWQLFLSAIACVSVCKYHQTEVLLGETRFVEFIFLWQGTHWYIQYVFWSPFLKSNMRTCLTTKRKNGGAALLRKAPNFAISWKLNLQGESSTPLNFVQVMTFFGA